MTIVFLTGLFILLLHYQFQLVAVKEQKISFHVLKSEDLFHCFTIYLDLRAVTILPRVERVVILDKNGFVIHNESFPLYDDDAVDDAAYERMAFFLQERQFRIRLIAALEDPGMVPIVQN